MRTIGGRVDLVQEVSGSDIRHWSADREGWKVSSIANKTNVKDVLDRDVKFGIQIGLDWLQWDKNGTF